MKFHKTLLLGALCITSLSPATYANEIDIVGNDVERLKSLQVSYIGDLELSCGALSEEAGNMNEVIHTTQEIKNNSQMSSHGVTAAGAIGSLLIGTATGGIGLAVGGFLMTHNIEERGEQADDMQDIAAQRRTLMIGIYNAKNCKGPIEHALQPPDEFDPMNKIALNADNKYQSERRKRYND